MAQKPCLISIGGLSGSGKSTLAKALLPKLPNAIHIDSDVLRKEMFGVSPTTKLPPEAYSKEASGRLFEELDKRIRVHLTDGKTVIVSAMHNWQGYRASRATLAAECGADFHGVWLDVSEETMLARVAARTNDASDVGVDHALVQIAASKKYPVTDWKAIDASQPTEKIVSDMLAMIYPAAKPKKPSGPKMG